jgi:hypothetical protein
LRAKIFSGADGSETAFIGQNYVGLTVLDFTTATIPLPLAVSMFGGGLLSMLSLSKRSKFI